MPTAARLVAALTLALTALATTHNIVPLLPESQALGRFYEINIAIGLVVGWITVGGRVGRGIIPSLFDGITGGFLLTFWALLLYGFLRMWKLSLRKMYEEPVEAILGWVQESITYATLLVDIQVLLSLVIGSLVTGLLAELANRNFN